MNKTLLKLATVGAAVTILLTMLMISGCKENLPADNNPAQSTGTGWNETSDTQDLPPDQEYDTPDTQDTELGDVDIVLPTEDDSDIDISIKDTPSQGDTPPQLNKPDAQDTEPTIGNTQTDGKPAQPTQPSQSETEPKYSVTLKDYEAMKPNQQLAYMQSFPSVEDYVEWLRWAQAEDVDDGVYLEDEDGVVEINP